MANMNAAPYNYIRPHLPPTWVVSSTVQTPDVPSHTSEYNDVMRHFSIEATRLVRHQNVNQYGLFLVRQQHLLSLNPDSPYVVTRYCMINASSVEDALKFNLDERRLGAVTLSASPLRAIPHGKVVLVVRCVIDESQFGDNDIKPTRDSDFYIEYVVYFS